MKLLPLLTATTVLCLSSNAFGGISFTVTPSLAPNAFGSSNYSEWVNNSIVALQNGYSDYSQPSDPGPAVYHAAPLVLNVSDIIVTNFPSWRGNANPGATYGPDYANELGTRLHFGLDIVGTAGMTFSASQLSLDATSSDPDNSLGFTRAAGTYNYGFDLVGIKYGADGQKGGGDDTVITSGPNTQTVNEIVFRGSGNAFAVLSDDPGATNQDKIDMALANLPSNFTFTGQYSITDSNNLGFSGSATVLLVPEPSTYAMILGAGLTGLVAWGKRRRSPLAAV